MIRTQWAQITLCGDDTRERAVILLLLWSVFFFVFLLVW